MRIKRKIQKNGIFMRSIILSRIRFPQKQNTTRRRKRENEQNEYIPKILTFINKVHGQERERERETIQTRSENELV
jgi:hypothetical protein